MATEITYKNNLLTSFNSGMKILKTAGKYMEDDVTISTSDGYVATPATTITANPTISVNASGLITATTSASQNITPTVEAGYVSTGTAGTVTVSGSNTQQLSTQAAATITPSTTSQTAVAAGKYTTGAVTVAAMPAGTAGTPTASKGAVNNHSISVTPSVTNTTGYILGDTKTGTAVTVTASELVSGTKSITENGTGIDVANYASVNVAVPSAGGYTRTLIVPQQTVTAEQTQYGKQASFTNFIGGLEDAKHYIVTLDGVEWFTTCETLWRNNYTIGDTSWFLSSSASTNDLVYPFSAMYDGNDFSIALSNTTQHTVKIERVDFIAGTALTLQAKTGINPSTSSQTITPDSGYDGLSSVQINAITAMTLPTSASSTGAGTTKATIGRSTSAQYINIPVGYNDTAASYTISAVANGSATAPATITGTGATVSHSGTTVTFTKTISVTPSVTAGYVSSGTAGNSSVSLSATDANLVAANIVSGVTIFGVTGSAASATYTNGDNLAYGGN